MNSVYIVDYYVTNFLGRDMHSVAIIRNSNDLKRLLELFARLSPSIYNIYFSDKFDD